MADKQLFNQPLKTTFSDTDRIALGIPGIEGCDNMLMQVFVDLLKNTGVEAGSIVNANLVSYVWTLTHNKETQFIELTIYDGNGVKQSTDGMLRIVSLDEIEIDFGGDISGTWTYIFKYWYL